MRCRLGRGWVRNVWFDQVIRTRFTSRSGTYLSIQQIAPAARARGIALLATESMMGNMGPVRRHVTGQNLGVMAGPRPVNPLTKTEPHDRDRDRGADEVGHEPDDKFEAQSDERVAKDDPSLTESIVQADKDQSSYCQACPES